MKFSPDSFDFEMGEKNNIKMRSIKTYKLFFSWQSDRGETKKIIFKVLYAISKELRSEGINLVIDHDTRERTGKKKIEDDVISKIETCDIFVADITPITTLPEDKEKHRLPKHLPNSNVLFELGYAQKAKGNSRMIILAKLDKHQDEHVEFMPFDINHDTITMFESEKDLKGMGTWIRNIMKEVDKDRAMVIPEYSALLLFNNNGELSEETVVAPTFLRRIYVRPHEEKNTEATEVAAKQEAIRNVMAGNSLAMWEYMLNKKPDNVVEAKIVTKEIYHSYSPVEIVIVNNGNMALENVTIQIYSENEYVKFRESNEKELLAIPKIVRPGGLFVDERAVNKHYETLNPQVQYSLETFYVFVPLGIDKCNLKYTISSKQKRIDNELHVVVIPQYHNQEIISKTKEEGTYEDDEYIESM